jgi:acetyl-CoA C-acetyltransferase
VPLGGITTTRGPPRAELEKMALPRSREGGRLTAAVASQISDGARGDAGRLGAGGEGHGLTPRARIHHMSRARRRPDLHAHRADPGHPHALEKTGMKLDDIDLVEINEAFASVVLAWQKELDADLSKVNVNGGAIALGHPLGATGARLMTTLLNELERTGGRYGLQTMCEGGGQANVTIIERLSPCG